ncbi:TraB/GumN family protein [Evansella sp. AB-rgal1]|uniref:TraB/GumN family protein n=1 Tax=Evansella sp. AB-rgal1 TaxID=3242696 RepID=UPI00359D2897
MRKLCKGTLVALLTILLMLSTVVPTLASDQEGPDVSEWAIEILNEGERYGIFPMEWYYDSFRGEVSQDRLEILLSLTDGKIAELGLEKNEDFTPESYNSDGTRGDIITRLYNIVAQYDLPVGESAVDYMQEQGILKGTTRGLELDSVATTEQAVIFAVRLVQDTYYQVQAGAKGVAWKVENDGNLVYLLGSIHLGTTDLYPFNEKLVNAFHESDALVVEANLFDLEGLQYFMQKSMFDDETTIEDVLSEETYNKLVKVLEGYGIPVEYVAFYKPWSIASDLSNISLSESLGTPAEELASLGIDMYFLTNAMLGQKPILELEGIAAQADMFDGLSAEAQEDYLADVLDSILEEQTYDESEAELLKEWFKYWSAGDIDGFTESLLLLDGEPTEFDEMLLGERDKNMAEGISQLLESEEKGTYFVVVGAAHFLTEGTILYYLEEKGYTIEAFYE